MPSTPPKAVVYPGRFNLYAVQTPGQTLGPFFHQGLLRGPSHPFGSAMTGTEKEAPGEQITITGRVLDGLRRPVGDALLEIWQADAQGVYPHPLDTRGQPTAGFLGFGRTSTDDNGRYSFRTVKPGCVPGPGGLSQASHINLIVGARGLMRHAFTRIYFANDADLSTCPILSHVPSERRQTLLAELQSDSVSGVNNVNNVNDSKGVSYRFDVHLQGPSETVFFDV